MFSIFQQHLIDIAKVKQICSSEGLDLEDWVLQAFIRTFNELPRVVNYLTAIDKEPEEEDFSTSELIQNIIPMLDKGLRSKNINVEKTTINICNKYSDSIIIRMLEAKPIIYNEQFVAIPAYGIVMFHQNNIVSEIFECFISKEASKTPNVLYVSKGSYGFETHPFKLNVKDIEGNYNDDLPLEKINNIIESDDSSIMLFNGIPGGGKSSFIRYLISTHMESKEFLYLDSSVFHAMTDSSFVQFLLKHKNSVIILEDCEQVLKSREDNSRNELISTILNISDGLLGDSLNLKFICTFNTDLNNIDKAITRKGRLKLKYEFKPLTKEKVTKIFEKRGIDTKLAKEMTLAEVYNFEEDNGVNVERKSVGFGV